MRSDRCTAQYRKFVPRRREVLQEASEKKPSGRRFVKKVVFVRTRIRDHFRDVNNVELNVRASRLHFSTQKKKRSLITRFSPVRRILQTLEIVAISLQRTRQNGRRRSNEVETRPTQSVLSNHRRGIVTYRTRGTKERTNYPWTSALPPAGISPVVAAHNLSLFPSSLDRSLSLPPIISLSLLSFVYRLLCHPCLQRLARSPISLRREET